MATLNPEPPRRSDSNSQHVDAGEPEPNAEQRRTRRRRQSARIFEEPEPIGNRERQDSYRAAPDRQNSFGPSFPPATATGGYGSRDYPSGHGNSSPFRPRYGAVPPPDPAYYTPSPSGPYDFPSSAAYGPRRRTTWEEDREREREQRRRREDYLFYLAVSEAERRSRRQRSPSPRRSRRRRSVSPSPPPIRRRRRNVRDYDDDYVSYDSSTSSFDEGTYRYESDDDDFNATRFEFKPSRVSRSASAESGDYLDDGHSPKPAAGAGEDPRVLRVYQSQYTGDAFLEGTHTLKLTGLRHGPGNVSEPSTLTPNHSQGEKKEPLFRWLHIPQQMMSFDKLSNDVTSITWLSQSERNGLTKLLAEVKKNCIKTKQTYKGSHVKYMEPRFIQVSMKPDASASSSSAQKGSRSVSWLSIPYFTFEKYSGLLSAANPTSFPPLTLLQAQYSRTAPQRDSEQVVCQLPNADAGSCFHIAQLWCIVVDTSLLVTCGTMSAKSLKGEAIIIASPEPPLSNDEGGAGLGRIYVSYSEAVLWSFPLNECKTWLEFHSHFYDFWPEPIQFSHRDKTLSGDDWNKIYNLVKHSSYKVILALKVVSRPHPPQRGILKSIEAENPRASEEPDELEDTRQSRSENRPSRARRERHSTSHTRQDEEFHVFSWLDAGIDSATENRRVLFRTLKDVENYLLLETKTSDNTAYRNCPEEDRGSLFDYLREEGLRVGEESTDQKRKQKYEQRVDILNAADAVFRFFLPVGVDVPTATRYWGAVRILIQMPSRERDEEGDEDEDEDDDERPEDVNAAAARAHVPSARWRLRDIAKTCQHVQNLMSHVQPSDRAKIVIPDQLVTAWIHTLMGVIYATQDSQVWEDHLGESSSGILNGLDDITSSLPGHGDLLKQAVILPLEIVSVVSFKLLQDATNGSPSISETYSEYLEALGAEITTKPSDRSTQHRISLLKQELAVIRKTVAAQNSIFAAIITSTWRAQVGSGKEAAGNLGYNRSRVRSYRPDHTREVSKSFIPVGIKDTYVSRLPEESASRRRPDYEYDEERYYSRDRSKAEHYYQSLGVDSSVLDPEEFYKLSPTHPGGFRDLLAAECVSFLERRLRDFDEYDDHAAALEETNANKLDTTKDRQEMAIYAFTIVTIIFLPLSAVAGIFGMNTADVRDMDLNQWAYWAAAVPVTVVVILLGLWWMGELGNAVSWILRRPPRSGGGGVGRSGAYAIIPPWDSSPPYAGRPPLPPGYWPDTVQLVRPGSPVLRSRSRSRSAVQSARRGLAALGIGP